MARAEWVKCVRDGHKLREGLTWCGRKIMFAEWCWTSIDHAANAGRSGDRLTVCPRCRKAIILALRSKDVPDYALFPAEAKEE